MLYTLNIRLAFLLGAEPRLRRHALKIKIRDELIPLNLLVLVLIAAIALFPSNGLRIALGLPFLLFFPGYTLMAALFPQRESIGAIERVGLSFGMSIAVVPLIGLILNYTPWGITLGPILYSIATFIFIMSLTAWFRRKKLTGEKRFFIEFPLRTLGWGGSIWDKVASIILVLAILGALGTLGYAIAMPKIGEKFTEFYVSGLEGGAEGYPNELVVGDTELVIVGIVNREHEPVTYRVEAVIDGAKNNEVGPVMLEHNGRWEATIGFTPDRLGNNQKVEFLLYKNGGSEAYLTLHLWINVTDRR